MIANSGADSCLRIVCGRGETGIRSRL